MPSSCPCGKGQCDCCKTEAKKKGKRKPDFDPNFDDQNMSFLGGQIDEVKIAWVHANCKFAGSWEPRQVDYGHGGVDLRQSWLDSAIEELNKAKAHLNDSTLFRLSLKDAERFLHYALDENHRHEKSPTPQPATPPPAPEKDWPWSFSLGPRQPDSRNAQP